MLRIHKHDTILENTAKRGKDYGNNNMIDHTYYFADPVGAKRAHYIAGSTYGGKTYISNNCPEPCHIYTEDENCKMNKSIEQKVINNEEIEGSLLSDDKLRGDFYILVFIFSIVNCMIICEFWIHQRRREIAIRKAYGYSNMQVVKLITSSMFKIIIASCVCGYLLQVCFSHIMEQQGIKFEWSVLNIIRVIILIIMTTIISMVVPICKIIKRTPIQELTQKGVI